MLRREKDRERRIALERIVYLIERAQKFKFIDYELARRYIELAKKISMKYRVRIPRKYKTLFCRKCLYPYRSDRLRVRIHKSEVIVTCLNCSRVKRYQLKSSKASKSLK
ncbi:MAG: ribonuclease P [Archaeoglobaceae archaeon]|uniref:Ribonuclease P protein component 4 n=1 Tax=Archaeoglobus fulgidus TaxID=2234 RepID=A0A7J3M4S7_ARCFL